MSSGSAAQPNPTNNSRRADPDKINFCHFVMLNLVQHLPTNELWKILKQDPGQARTALRLVQDDRKLDFNQINHLVQG